MLAHKLITELKSLGFTGSAGDMLKKYLKDRFTLPDATINDLLKDGLNSTDINRALADLVADANDSLTGVTITDPYFANVVSLLHFDSGNPITDVKGRTWTAVGQAQISAANPKFGAGCALFDGVGDAYTTPKIAADEVGSSSFCVEGWILRPATVLNTRYVCGKWDANQNTDWAVFTTTDRIAANVYVDGGLRTVGWASGGQTWDDNYHHFALVRNGNVFTLYKDGVAGPTTYTSSGGAITTSTNVLAVGRAGGLTGSTWDGRIDEFRFTVGVPRYTGNFTPLATAFPDS